MFSGAFRTCQSYELVAAADLLVLFNVHLAYFAAAAGDSYRAVNIEFSAAQLIAALGLDSHFVVYLRPVV